MTIKDFNVGDEVYILDQRFTRYSNEPTWEVAKVTKIGRKYITVDRYDWKFCDAFSGRSNYLVKNEGAYDCTTDIKLFKCKEDYTNLIVTRIRSFVGRLNQNTLTLDQLQRILAIMEEQ